MLRFIRLIFEVFRSAIFLFLLSLGLRETLVQTRLDLTSKTAQVACISANATTAATLNKKQMAKGISKTKAKARLKRNTDPVPLVSIGAAVTFKASDMTFGV